MKPTKAQKIARALFSKRSKQGVFRRVGNKIKESKDQFIARTEREEDAIFSRAHKLFPGRVGFTEEQLEKAAQSLRRK